MIEADTEIYASSPADDMSVANAKEWIKAQGLTSEDVKLIRCENTVVIVALRPLELKIPSAQNLKE